MKKLMSALVFSMVSICAYGQISMLRYNDDFRTTGSDSFRKNAISAIKYIRLSENVNISFGGELREQYQFYKNRNFGDAPGIESAFGSDQLMQRAMAHTNIEIGKKVRVFSQLGSTFRFLNKNPPTPEIDENHLSLHQAFLDYQFAKKWMARVGRQELAYGSHRLITFREGPNTRLTFDGAVVRYKSSEKNIDFFALTPVKSNPGIFDDESFEDLIYGAYFTQKLMGQKLLVDYYIIDFRSNRRNYHYASGKEHRQSYGLRLFSKNPRFNYELEGTYQSGKFNDLKISANSLSTDVKYKVRDAGKFVIGLNGSYISGDKDPNDNCLNTYNILFSKPQYGLAAPIGATNIANLASYLSISPIKEVSINAGFNLMWRQSNKDGTYSPLGSLTRPKASTLSALEEKEIGKLLTLEADYTIAKNLLFSFDAAYFLAGSYIRETGKGKNITYLSFKAGYKF